MSVTKKLSDKGLISPPKFVPGSVQYECYMGSVCYGVSSEFSDIDVYGFCIPDKETVFPHLAGEIEGFGKQKKQFGQFQQHHIKDNNGVEYDLTIYNIVKFFQLCMENNPNMVDALFVPSNLVTTCTHVGDMVRDNRRLFLHKGSWHKFKGYAYSQLHKIRIKTPNGKRAELVEKYGYDVKFAYHVVRLLGEVEQILSEGDLDLQRNKEQLKSIRRGEWKLEEIEDYFYRNEKNLEKLYIDSKLPHSPDEEAIRTLLFDCLEEFYGSLESAVVREDEATRAIRQIKEIVEKVNT